MHDVVQNNNELIMNLYVDWIKWDIKFRFKKAPNGWVFDLMGQIVNSGKDGMAFFEALNRRDFFSYPSWISCYFESWWCDIEEGTLSYSGIQDQLDRLCVWLSECERTKPIW